MKAERKLPKAHLFICTHTRSNGQACGNRGSSSLREKIKSQLGSPSDLSLFRINASGCLGRCSEGVVCVLYPNGIVFTEVDPASEDDQNTLVQTVLHSLTPPEAR